MTETHNYITIYIVHRIVYKYLYRDCVAGPNGGDLMNELLEPIRYIHITAGFFGLAAFWVPVFARKGGNNHRLFGKIFKYSAYLVLYAAMVAVALRVGFGIANGAGPRANPSSFAFLMFLGYLAVVTFIVLRHGVTVLENKDLVSMNTAWNRFLAQVSIAASLALVAYTVYFSPPNQIILYALSPIGISSGFGILKAIKGRRTEGRAWFYEHMGAMIGAGIAFHTAFAVFGANAIFDLGILGWAAVIPWILPALVGIPATVIWTRHYQRKFGDLPA